MPRPRGRLRVLEILLWTFACLGASLATTTMGEECDWTGSGLELEQGVTPVYLRCSEGKVTWSYPSGALRVLLRFGSSGRDFLGCIKTSGSWPDARIYLEGTRGLVMMMDIVDHKKNKVRCFHSRGGQAALYIEAPRSLSTFPKHVSELLYDLQALPRSEAHQLQEECRPCSKSEMSHAYCTSDLVTRGIMRRVERIEETSVINVKVTTHLRHSTASSAAADDNDVNHQDTEGTIELTMPGHCGANIGDGEFVFMARRKLGDLAITCAPRLEEWSSVVSDETSSGNANCVLTS